MDQVKVGEFISSLRKEKNYTQKQLADILGVTDKAISRWETGKGFPEVSLLLPLCKELEITVNELLTGERISEAQYKVKAEENLMQVLSNSTFTLKEKIRFYRRKWLKEHVGIIILAVVAWLGVQLLLKFQGVDFAIVAGICAMPGVLLYIVLYNRMMVYVEKHAYDGSGN